MPSHVAPLHYVAIEYCLDDNSEDNGGIETSGQHRFLYGVESWIDGVDQQLEGLQEGELLELRLDSGAAALVVYHLLPQLDLPETESNLALRVKIVEVVKAEPREVIKALAATVHCCDHCGDH
jgi:hypothetical protein